MSYSIGDIVLVYVDDPNGEPCEWSHPAIIYTAIDDPDGCYVVAISTKFDPQSIPDSWIPIPYNKQGKAMTGMKLPCVAKTEWLVEINPQTIEKRYGSVPDRVLKDMVNRINKRLEGTK